ncbi:MAG: hypothetical protein Q7N50_04935 [Armatimonadota bacterium]|nr:hypothetical protein [Armatimonadota bacterium]
MKTTVIILIGLCLILGGIAGWALRGVTTMSKAPAMINITPESYSDWNRIAIYDGGMLIVADYNSSPGTIEIITKRRIK